VLLDHWPLAGLRLTTPDLELRWPTNEELADLADIAAEGIHDPGFMPFLFPWTDTTPAVRARSVIQHFWRKAGEWQPDEWTMLFVVFRGRQPMGIQAVSGKQFALTREVATGSWLGQRYQGQGVGTQMRAAVLCFAFEHLGAQSAVSGAMMGNEQSLGVSRKLGYREDGIARVVVSGQLRIEQRLRIDATDFKAPFPVPVDGLENCLNDFGL
jgi:RimJ/RimL family protein N-acetyltransferase